MKMHFRASKCCSGRQFEPHENETRADDSPIQRFVLLQLELSRKGKLQSRPAFEVS